MRQINAYRYSSHKLLFGSVSEKSERYQAIQSMRGSCEMWTIIGCSNSWFEKLNTNNVDGVKLLLYIVTEA